MNGVLKLIWALNRDILVVHCRAVWRERGMPVSAQDCSLARIRQTVDGLEHD